MARPEGFVAPPQHNPAGYYGTGRGSAPHATVHPITFPGATETDIATPTPDKTVAPTNTGPQSHPLFASSWGELGVGVARIKELGVLGARL